jgi:WD40 repeat protein
MKNKSLSLLLSACSFGFVFSAHVAPGAEAGDLESIKSELRSIREQVEKQGRQIDALYRVVDDEMNIDERLKGVDERKAAREQEEAREKKLALERLWSSSEGGLTDRAECSPTEQSFAVVTQDGGVRICDFAGKVLRRLRYGEEQITSIAHSPGGNQLLAATASGKLMLWDLKAGTAREVTGRSYQIDRVAWLGKTGRALVCSKLGEGIKGPQPGELRDVEGDLIEVDSGKALWSFTGWQHLDYQNLMAAPNGEWLAVFKILKDRGVFLLDASSGQITGRLLTGADQGLSVAVSPDSQMVAVGNPGVYLWDVKRREILRHLEGHQNWVVALAFSADGRLLVSGAGDSTARVWDVKSGAELGRIRFPGSSTYVHSVGFSCDDKRVLAAAGGGSLVVARVPALPSGP